MQYVEGKIGEIALAQNGKFFSGNLTAEKKFMGSPIVNRKPASLVAMQIELISPPQMVEVSNNTIKLPIILNKMI
jgi:hypothetical protein